MQVVMFKLKPVLWPQNERARQNEKYIVNTIPLVLLSDSIGSLVLKIPVLSTLIAIFQLMLIVFGGNLRKVDNRQQV